MPPGIRATVEFDDPDVCRISALSAAAETTIDSVCTNVCPGDCDEGVVEFSVDSSCDLGADVTPIFSHGSTDRYRLPLDDADCPCHCLAQFGCPVARYTAQAGTVTIVFHAVDYDQLQGIVSTLRDRFPSVNIKRFVRSPADERSPDGVFVNRGKLTPRQLEALETAYEMGYFDRSRRSNATEVADELDIAPSTFREHLSAAERKILVDLL